MSEEVRLPKESSSPAASSVFSNDGANRTSSQLPLQQQQQQQQHQDQDQDQNQDQEQTCPASSSLSSTQHSEFLRRLDRIYLKIPVLNKIPSAAAGIIILIALVNCLVWAVVGIVLRFHEALTGTAILAYTLGLRHALDADHISAIDLTTRRLIASGQRPVTVGTWFSLGHSTIVVVTAIVVAATASAISKKFNNFSRIGGIVGSSVSSAFLLLLGAANAYVFYLLVRRLKRVIAATRQHDTEAVNSIKDPERDSVRGGEDVFQIQGGGLLVRVFIKFFKLIDRPWKMYPLGVCFGLGFDTSSEVALLGLSALQATHGTSLWLILIYPVLFTAGMCLLDTVDGALMMSLYTSATSQKDPLKVLYYNVVLTGVTVLVAIIIGTIQLLSLVLAVDSNLKGPFWDGVQNASNRYDVIGGAICGMFLTVGIGSVIFYPHWRRWICRSSKAKETRNDVAENVHEDDGGYSGTVLITSDEDSGNAQGQRIVTSKKQSHVHVVSAEERE